MEIKSSKKNKFPKLIEKVLLVAVLSTLFIFNSIIFAEENPGNLTWINKDAPWNEGTGCVLNVEDTNTGKYTAAAYNKNYKDNVTWSNSVSIGHSLYIDAYTMYNGGKLWVYEGGVLTHEIDAGNREHIYLDLTVTTVNVKIACSASGYARLGEELSVTINAIGDSTAPTLTVNTPYVVTGDDLSFTIQDNVGAVGYYISSNPDTPLATTAGWHSISSSTNTTQEVTQTELGNFYIWAKDQAGNVSDRKTFEVGLLPDPDPVYAEDYEIKEGESIRFEARTRGGTTPFTYQWYESTTDAYNGTPISGATSLTYRADNIMRDKNNHYFYCVITNRFGSWYSRRGKLTVLFEPKFASLDDALLKINETHTYKALVASTPSDAAGNTTKYTYQWYSAGDETGVGTLIAGEVGQTFTVVPSADGVMYYYCVIKNYRLDEHTVAYTVTTPNRGKITADITRPVVTKGDITFNQTPNERNGKKYINSGFTVNIPFTITDADKGYKFVEDGNNFTASDVIIYVDGVEKACQKSINYTKKSDYKVEYVLSVTGIPDNGILSFKIPANSFTDRIGNGNDEFSTYTTNIMVDNSKPTISQYSYVGGANEKYINEDDSLHMRLIVNDNYGFDKAELTVDDIIVKVGSQNENSDISKELLQISGNNNEYIYELILQNVKGDGPLSLDVAVNRIYDWATNGNAFTNVPMKVTNGDNIIVDNTAPSFDESGIIATLGSYDSSRNYPGSLNAWHENWTNETVYITINATDENKIDYYTTSKVSNDPIITKLTVGTLKNQEALVAEYEGYMYYRVFDMAGNSTEHRIMIKIDKTKPVPTKLEYYELRVNGVKYTYSPDEPSNRNIVINPVWWGDDGTVKSGIMYDSISSQSMAYDNKAALTTTDNKWYPSYYKVTHYKDMSRTSAVGSPVVYHMKENSMVFEEDGFYVVDAITTDIAGNYTIHPEEYIYIRKSTNNTLRLTRISDVGSGVKQITIDVYKASETDPNVRSNIKVISQIKVNNPGKTYETTLKLGRGTFFVDVWLYDFAEDGNGNPDPNSYHLEKKIQNNF